MRAATSLAFATPSRRSSARKRSSAPAPPGSDLRNEKRPAEGPGTGVSVQSRSCLLLPPYIRIVKIIIVTNRAGRGLRSRLGAEPRLDDSAIPDCQAAVG